MPVRVCVGNKCYDGDNKRHAEEVMFATGKYDEGALIVTSDAWPCTGTGKKNDRHNCDKLYTSKSKGRTITVQVSGDHAGYAADYGKALGSTGTLTYVNGVRTVT